MKKLKIGVGQCSYDMSILCELAFETMSIVSSRRTLDQTTHGSPRFFRGQCPHESAPNVH